MGRTRLLIIGLLTPFLVIAQFASVQAYDLFGQQVCQSGTKAAQSPACQQAGNQTGSSTDNPLVHTIDVAANILAVATGVAAIIMIIISALTLVTSGGDAEAVKGARRRLMFSLIGLFVVAIAWTLTRFITDRLIQ